MAIDPNLNVSAEGPSSSVIENELPAYRAISTSAVFALIFGVMSILTFASPYFLVFSVLAIFFGFKAEKSIQKFPDMFTGRKIAQAGFGLGLIFGLSAITVGTVQGVLRANSAKAFAREMESVIQGGTLEQVIWYMQPPSRRENIKPEELLEKMRGKGGGSPQMFDTQYGTVKGIKEAIADPGAEIHFSSIEKHGDFELIMYALAVYEIHNSKAKDPAKQESFALMSLKAAKNDKGKYEWWIEDIKYPYQPNTFVLPTKAADDGHGHGEGDGHGH